MDTSIAALGDLIFVTTEICKAIVSELSKLDHHIQTTSAIKTAFIHVRSFIIKCHELAEYICSEEKYLVNAIAENNNEELQDFLKEVFAKSQSCQKDVKVCKDYINNVKPSIVEEEQKRKLDASKRAEVGASVAVVGGLTASAGISAAFIGLQGIVFLPVGLAVASVGLVTAMKGRSVYSNNKKKEQTSNEVLEAFDGIEGSLETIDETLDKANKEFKLATGLEMDTPNYSSLSAPATSSLMEAINEMTTQSDNLRNYCQLLKDEERFEDFILLCGYNIEVTDSK